MITRPKKKSQLTETRSIGLGILYVIIYVLGALIHTAATLAVSRSCLSWLLHFELARAHLILK